MEYFILRERLNLCTEKCKRAESAAGRGAAGSAISVWLQHSTSALHPPAATRRRAAASPSAPRAPLTRYPVHPSPHAPRALRTPCTPCTPRPALPGAALARGAAGSTAGGRQQHQPPRGTGSSTPVLCQAPSEPSALCHRWGCLPPSCLSIPGTARTGCQEASRRGHRAHRSHVRAPTDTTRGQRGSALATKPLAARAPTMAHVCGDWPPPR